MYVLAYPLININTLVLDDKSDVGMDMRSSEIRRIGHDLRKRSIYILSKFIDRCINIIQRDGTHTYIRESKYVMKRFQIWKLKDYI